MARTVITGRPPSFKPRAPSTTYRKKLPEERKHNPGAGRPRLDVDWDKVKILAHVHSTIEEIAEVTGVSPSTLAQRPEFLTIYKNGWHKGQVSLRRKQWRVATAWAWQKINCPECDGFGEISRSYGEQRQVKVCSRCEGKGEIPRDPTAQENTMMIFLGKNILGQSDRHEVSGPGGGPIQVNHRQELKRLSVEELETLKNLLEKAQAKEVIDLPAVEVRALPAPASKNGRERKNGRTVPV
jgi:hypothetical protein